MARCPSTGHRGEKTPPRWPVQRSEPKPEALAKRAHKKRRHTNLVADTRLDYFVEVFPDKENIQQKQLGSFTG